MPTAVDGYCRRLIAAGAVVVALGVGGGVVLRRTSEGLPSATAEPGPVARRPVVEALGKLPLYFVENRGQLDARVAYYIQGRDKVVYFTASGVTFALSGHRAQEAPTPRVLLASWPRAGLEQPAASSAPRWAVKLDFLGSNKAAQPVGEDHTSAVVSYFKGNRDQWKAGLPTYSRVVYRDLWPGIDLAYSGTVNRLKYEFVLQPGASPEAIRLAYRGATVEVNAEGQLEVSTPSGGFRDEKPYAYQEVDGRRVEVAAAYDLEGDEYGFQVGAYDARRPLVLDPAVVVYAGYIGGSGTDGALGIAVDGSGNAYVTGATTSSEATFPVNVGPDTSYNGGTVDAFVAKVNAAGTALVYAGYIGGTDLDQGTGIAVDGSGNAYVTGVTSSSEASFPVTVGPDLTFGGFNDGFVAKMNALGTALIYAGYIGGSSLEQGAGIAVDGSGNAYVTGFTGSSEATFPVIVGPDLTINSPGGGLDAFVAKVNAAGTAFDYAGYLGGSGDDRARAIAVDAAGNAYVTGITASNQASFPVIVGPDLTFNAGVGGADSFVAKVNSAGTALAYAGYIAGSGGAAGIAVDGSGNAYITGYTFDNEAIFPVTVGPDITYNGGGGDAFVAKVNAAGTGLDYAGYIGGTGFDVGRAIAVDGSGNAYVTGGTLSTQTSFPVIDGPDLTANGSFDAFVVKVNPAGTALIYAGFIGGSSLEDGTCIAVDGAGHAYVGGRTQSSAASFPATVGPDLTLNGSVGGDDAFVAKIGDAVPANQPPVANAGPDQTIECASSSGTAVALNGSGSSDPNIDPLTYNWIGPFPEGGGTVTGNAPTVTVPLGVHTITLVVNDGQVNSAPDSVQITVRDTVAPLLSVSLSPETLWSPNHKLVTITATILTSDQCSIPSVVLQSIVSSEADSGLGVDDLPNDIQGAAFGTNDQSFEVRAERYSKDGRKYTVRYQATDSSGNSRQATAQVTVPHDQKL